MLRIDLKIGQSIKIGEHIVVTLDDKSGKVAKLAIEADPSIRVTRVHATPAGPDVAALGITGKPTA